MKAMKVPLGPGPLHVSPVSLSSVIHAIHIRRSNRFLLVESASEHVARIPDACDAQRERVRRCPYAVRRSVMQHSRFGARLSSISIPGEHALLSLIRMYR